MTEQFATVDQVQALGFELYEAKGHWLALSSEVADLRKSNEALTGTIRLFQGELKTYRKELRERHRSLSELEQWKDEEDTKTRFERTIVRRRRRWLKYVIGFAVAVAEAVTVKLLVEAHQSHQAAGHVQP